MAISTIGAALEQKVWLETTSALYPNFYMMLVGHPGVGKSRTIDLARELVTEIPEFHLAPISLTWAALVDAMEEAKRHIVRPPIEPFTYNSMYICADEMGAFIHKFDNEMTDGLSAFYEPRPYSQKRRTSDINLFIKRPQVNMLCGSTPQNLTDLLPEKAWGQGFMSRVIMIFSDDRIIVDDFSDQIKPDLTELTKDLTTISNLYGRFIVKPSYQKRVAVWRNAGEPILPGHPRLIHYNARRKTNLYKLSMISAVNRGNALVLEDRDFVQALAWMLEAEKEMPEIFKAGAVNADGLAMDDIYHQIVMAGEMSEGSIIHYARNRLPLHSITRVIDVLVNSGQIKLVRQDKLTGTRYYQPITPEPSGH